MVQFQRLFSTMISKVFDPPTYDHQNSLNGIGGDQKSSKPMNNKLDPKSKQSSENRLKLLIIIFGLVKFVRRQAGVSDAQ